MGKVKKVKMKKNKNTKTGINKKLLGIVLTTILTLLFTMSGALAADTVNLGTFTYPTAESLGSVNSYSVFSYTFNNTGDMEGNIAVDTWNNNGIIGATDNVSDYYNSDENFIYVNHITGNTATEGNLHHGYSKIDLPHYILGDQINFDYSVNNNNGLQGTDSETGKSVLYIQNWKEIGQSFNHVSETTYTIDFDKAFEGLKTYASTQYQKANTGVDVQIVEDPNHNDIRKITITCDEGDDVVNLPYYYLVNSYNNKNNEITIVGKNGTTNYSLIVNVTGLSTESADLNSNSRNITIDGVRPTQYEAQGGKIMYNFNDFSGTVNAGQRCTYGIILAPEATVNANATHDGNIFAKTVANPGGEIHQNPYTPVDSTHTNISITKVWNDEDNADGIRPDSVTVHLFANGTEVKSAVLNDDNNWTVSFSKLDKYDSSNQEIKYTVTEDAVDGYSSEVTQSGNSFTVTNTHEVVKKTFTKVWNDNSNLKQKRPSTEAYAKKVHLYKDGTLVNITPTVTDNGSNTYTITFAGGLVDDGSTYTIKEDAIDGYTADNTEINAGGTITNTYKETTPTPSDGGMTTSKSTKVTSWDDRTYQINITAAVDGSSSENSGSGYNTVLVFELNNTMSYSGNWNYQGVALGSYKDIKNYILNSQYGHDMELFYGNSWTKMTFSDENNTPKWSVNGNVISDNDETIIYGKPSSAQYYNLMRYACSAIMMNQAVYAPDSKLAHVLYESQASPQTFSAIDSNLSINNSVSSQSTEFMKYFINKLNARSTWRSDNSLSLALPEVEKQLNQIQGDNKAVVIMASDKPSSSDYWHNGVHITDAVERTNSENELKTIVSSGTKVYVLSYGMSESDQAWYENIIGQGNVYDYTDLDALKSVLASGSSSNKVIEYKNVTIQDTVDSRFYVPDEEKTRLRNEGATVVENSDGTTTVKWTGVKVDASGVNKTINIKAKDNYIGGNNVTTNVADGSFVQTENGGKSPLDQPTVNVKSAFSVNDYEDVIFLGEKTPSKDSRDLSSELIKEAVNTYNLDGYAVQPSDFTVVWKDKDGNVVSEDELYNQGYNDGITKDTTWTATVTYNNLGTPTDESNANTDNYVSGEGDGTLKASNDGHYTVHVVKGQILLEKQIDDAYTKDWKTNEKINSNETFVFKIVREPNTTLYGADDQGETFYETIDFSSKNSGEQIGRKLISNLKAGTYTITEEDQWTPKYTFHNVEQIKTNEVVNGSSLISDQQSAAVNTNSRSITFTIGNRTDTSVKDDGNSKAITFAGLEDLTKDYSDQTNDIGFKDNTTTDQHSYTDLNIYENTQKLSVDGHHVTARFTNVLGNSAALTDAASAVNIFNK